jgi:hypothetical protein
VQVTNGDTIPSDATAVFANIEVRDATAAGGVRITQGGASTAGLPSAINYSDNGPSNTGMTVRLSTDGQLRLNNWTGSAINIKVDIQGYFTGDPGMGGSFTALTPANIYSTGWTGESQIGPDETRTVQIAGIAGVPDDESVAAIAVTVTARNWTSGGTITLWNADDEDLPGTTNVSFTGTNGVPSNGISSSALVQVSDDGEINIHNSSANGVGLTLVAQGWFTGPPEPDLQGPNPEPQVIDSEPTSGTEELTFVPPLTTEDYSLSNSDDGRVALAINEETTGHYEATAVDDEGSTVSAPLVASGESLTVAVTPGASATYPIVVVVLFNAADPADGATQDLYPDGQDLPKIDAGEGDAEIPTPTDVVEIVDGAGDELVQDLTAPEDAEWADESSGITTFSAGSSKVKVPKKKVSGIRISQKYYYYDPDGKNPRRSPWKKSWHDYCSSSPDTAGYFQRGGDKVYRMTSTGRGPCARHDLCIEYKQAPSRPYCDKKLKADMRQNCRYALGKVSFPSYIEERIKASCYGRASLYYAGVKYGTKRAGGWGHSGPSYYPTYSYKSW